MCYEKHKHRQGRHDCNVISDMGVVLQVSTSINKETQEGRPKRSIGGQGERKERGE